jgi:uncharacterized 2Fe-2S/4Fe-4S cluster protein (DUF4445 family)
VENGQFKARVIGGGVPVGICGSGLVDAVACMLDEDIVDVSGYLEEDEFIIDPPVYLTPKDIRMLQLAKSAICAGLVTLIESEGMQASDISTLYIAGGFGNYLNRTSAARIGLLPKDLTEVSVVVGNAALSGASMMLLDPETRERAASLARHARVYDLSTSRIFSDKYMSCMMLEEI